MSNERKPDRQDRAQRWLRENAEAMQASNVWVEANGLPLAGYSMIRQCRGKLDWRGDLGEMRGD